MIATLNEKPSQSAKILAHIVAHGSITPLEALDRFGCFRLAARIHELKAAGHPIRCENEGGHARYSMARPVQAILAI